MKRRNNARMAGRICFERIKQYRRNARGSMAMIAAVALPLVMLAAGISIDYALLFKKRSTLQSAADAAALAGAKSLSLSDASRENVPAIVKAVVANFVARNAGRPGDAGVAVETTINNDPLEVKVSVSKAEPLVFARALGRSGHKLTASAIARVVGQPNICVLALEKSSIGAVWLVKNARMTGNNCSVFSNSTSSIGLAVRDGAILTAHSVCSAGGVENNGSISPDPITDCPQFEDPLASRPEPAAGECDYEQTVINGGVATLEPGVYCGGLKIGGTADVTMRPGNYLIKDGLLSVRDEAKVAGDGVSFFLGASTWLYFGPGTSIELAAAKDGIMAGLLFFGSRLQSKLLTHTILSRNAQKLVGTIYLPNNSFIVDGDASVGGASAYTAIVARRVVLLNGPHLVLNTNYALTDVPVPRGIRGAAQPIALVD